MEVIWLISDGSEEWEQKEQVTIIPDNKLQKCKTDADRQALIERLVEKDFRNQVSWVIYETQPGPAEGKEETE